MDIDRHFGALVAELDPDRGPMLALAAALASARTRQGHVCLALPEVAGKDWPHAGAERLPALGAWLDALEASPLVAGPDDEERYPLVLDDEGRLYLERLWIAERTVASALRGLGAKTQPEPVDAIAAGAPEGGRYRTPSPGPAGTAPDPHALEAMLDRLFPGAAPDDRPRTAARIAAVRRLCVVSGGPGTGKTTTAAAVVALLLGLGLAAPGRIALAAPTGKAAARLQEAVRRRHRELAANDLELCAFLEGYEAQATTVHRWLLSRHRTATPPVDALILDEVSMVDITLMARVLATLPAGARLVMLGDASQLASVQPGAVFADLCRAGAGPADAASPLAPCVVELVRNHRFDEGGGIGRLAVAIRDGDAPAAVAALQDPEDDAIELRPMSDPGRFEQLARLLADERFAPELRAMQALRAPAEGAGSPSWFRVLCAHRYGPFGSERFNDLVERRLRALGLVRSQDPFYPGRPILVARNDPGTGLSNGDTGVVLRGAAGQTRVWFPELADGCGRPRLVSPARLPPHESFFAVTVHRAQGSEYDEVAVVPGPAESRVATRELLYTAVTRSRRRVVVHGTAQSVRAAVERVTERSSGLRDALARPAAPDPTTGKRA